MVAYLTRHHKHGEDEDEAGLGHWEPAGLLQGEQDGSIQTGLSGAGGGARYKSPWPILSGNFM